MGLTHEVMPIGFSLCITSRNYSIGHTVLRSPISFPAPSVRSCPVPTGGTLELRRSYEDEGRS